MKNARPFGLARLVPMLAIAVATQVAIHNPALADALHCGQVFKQDNIQKYKQAIYSKGVDRTKSPDELMQIGYESEYLFHESAAILRDYLPDAKVMRKEHWLGLSDQQRIDWLKGQFTDRPEFAVDAGLHKNVDLDFMPQELIIDSTGNVEIVLAPFDSYAAWEKAVDTIVERYGVGSQQAMISKPRVSAFSPKNPKQQEQMTKEHLGWINFSQLKDMYLKLESGYERFQKDPTKLTALTFDHPFLGPMNKIKRDVLESYLKANAEGKKYDDDAKRFVRKSDASFKYTGGPSYRPDVAGPGRFSWELRNSHKDVADLKMKVKRDFVAHAEGLEKYSKFADVPAFDSIVVFDALPQLVRETLMALFPTKADPRFQYSKEEKLVLQMYRNFALPLMDMASLAKTLQESPIRQELFKAQIKIAQMNYSAGLKSISEQFVTKKIDAATAKAQIMGLLGQFTHNSGLAKAFEAQAKVIGHENIDPKTDENRQQTAVPLKKGA